VDIPVPIIFTTAYDEYAIQAFKLNSIDYLLKPIKFVALKAALTKFETIKGQYTNTSISTDKDLRDRLLNRKEPDYKMRFVAKIGDQIRHISIEDTCYFYAEDNLVYLVSIDNKHFIIDYTLEQLSTLLNPDIFFRATRGHIIKIDSIKKVHKYFNSRLKIELEPPFKDEVLVPRAKVNSFIEWMDR
jgi:DNA-binding LytR/AlgR family response regulator